MLKNMNQKQNKMQELQERSPNELRKQQKSITKIKSRTELLHKKFDVSFGVRNLEEKDQLLDEALWVEYTGDIDEHIFGLLCERCFKKFKFRPTIAEFIEVLEKSKEEDQFRGAKQ